MGRLRPVDRGRDPEDAPGRDRLHNAANAHLNRIQVVPLTSNIERVFLGETLVRVGNQTRKALATQIMTAAKERMGRQFGVLRPADLRAVESAILVQLGIEPRPVRTHR